MSWLKHGDPFLVERLRSTSEMADVQALLGRAARSWDLFALPDGTENPGREPDGRFEHRTLMPREQDINQALNRLLRQLFEPADSWLLDIPRALVPNRPSAEVVVSSDGGAVLGLPWSAFGSLFFLNQLVIALDLARTRAAGAGRPSRRERAMQRALIDRVQPDILEVATRHWLTGNAVSAPVRTQIRRLEDVLHFWLRTGGQSYKRFIWETTVFQQCQMLFHEFGHLAALDQRGGDPHVRQDTPWRTFLRFVDELAADAWGLSYKRELAGRLFAGGSLHAAQAAFCLFNAVDMTQFARPGASGRDELATRCAREVGRLAPSSIYGALSPARVLHMFDGVRELFARPVLLVHEFAAFEELLGALELSFADDVPDMLRGEASEAFQPWFRR